MNTIEEKDKVKQVFHAGFGDLGWLLDDCTARPDTIS